MDDLLQTRTTWLRRIRLYIGYGLPLQGSIKLDYRHITRSALRFYRRKNAGVTVNNQRRYRFSLLNLLESGQ